MFQKRDGGNGDDQECQQTPPAESAAWTRHRLLHRQGRPKPGNTLTDEALVLHCCPLEALEPIYT